MKKLLVTGSSGLIGSEVCIHFAALGWEIHGVDNNQRAVFFGPQGDTRWNQGRLAEALGKSFHHHELDIRDRQGVLALLQEIQPNSIALTELETRWDYADPAYADGITEEFSIDQSKHSLFGASKVAADVMVQEYGRYFGLPTCCLRGGCLTGPNHSGVELHGFLSYLVKCNLEGREYKVFGYKGKQVRDNIHSHDVARFIEEFIAAPRIAEVYNIGGGRANSCSIWEAFKITEKFSGKAQVFQYLDENRVGDHICYISDLSKMRNHYPDWDITISLEETIRQILTHSRP